MKRTIAFTLFLAVAPQLVADEKLKGIACRSVHLGYPAPADAIAFSTELIVEKSATGTYFMACGWDKGYFGVQELGDGKKLAIFSVWDPGSQDDPKKVDPAKQVQTLFKGKGVRVGRFGNEGTGGQSFFDFDWKVGQTYRFLVTAEPKGKDRTAFAGYIGMPDEKEWKHLITFSTLTERSELRGLYSFVEDFKRDKVSTTRERRAEFGNGVVVTKDRKFVALEKARFTADANPVLNIDAGVAGGRFFLATGGNITNDGTKLNATMTRPPMKGDWPAGIESLIPGKTP